VPRFQASYKGTPFYEFPQQAKEFCLGAGGVNADD
jgi:hypothetical protein